MTYSIPLLIAQGRALRTVSREIKAIGRNAMHVLVLKRAVRAKRKLTPR